MRYMWTEEQDLLRSTLQRYVAERCAADYRQRRLARGFDDEVWSEIAAMGVLGLPFEERFGGSGGSALDTLVVMEAFGRGLVMEPYIASVVLGGGLVCSVGDERQKSALIPALIAGQLRLAFGFTEAESRFNLAHVSMRAERDAGFCLSGCKTLVLGAPECQQLIVSARTRGAALDRDGISLFLVPRDAVGVAIRSYTCVNGLSAGEVTLSDVRVPHEALLGELHAALPAIERVVDEAICAICGEAVGAMAALNERCIAFAKTRQAFGKPIGQFQVIGHRLVDMSVSYEQASAIAIKAALKLSVVGAESSRTVSACKVAVAKEAAFIGKSAVQLHGAMGTTDELDIGHYFKRLTVMQTLFGSTLHHLRRYAELGTEGGAHHGY